MLGSGIHSTTETRASFAYLKKFNNKKLLIVSGSDSG